MANQPPKLFLKFFRWYCHPNLLAPVEGDLMELYGEREKTLGKRRADWLFIKDTLLLFRKDIIKSAAGGRKLNYLSMIKSYLKTSLRSIFRNRIVSTASILCLVLGTLCFQLIYLWVDNEVKTNTFHHKIDRIYATVVTSNPMSKPRAMSWSTFFKFDYREHSEIESKLTVHAYDDGEIKIRLNAREYLGKVLVVDSTFFEFFDFPFIDGVPGVLKDPSKILVTKSYAKRLFGDNLAVGKVIEINGDNYGRYVIGGILKDVPSTSSTQFDVLVPRHSQSFWGRSPDEYLLVKEQFNVAAFEDRVRESGRTHPQFKESTLSVTPFHEMYFDKTIQLNLYDKYGNRNHVKTLSIIAGLILLICGLSFSNLQTIHQLEGSKKIGIKQVNGATSFDLCLEMIIGRMYFLIATLLLVFLALELVYPFYLDVLDLKIDRNPVLEFKAIASASSLIVLLSTIVSAAQLLRINAIRSIKGLTSNFKIPKAQRFITASQFGITTALVITSTFMYLQVEFMTEENIGFEKENVLIINSVFSDVPSNKTDEEKIKEWENQKSNYKVLVNQLSSNPNISGFTQGEPPLDGMAYEMPWKKMGSQDEYTSKKIMTVDPDYFRLLDLKLLEGRFFSDSIDKSRQNKVIVNEAAMSFWGIENIGEAKLANSYWGGEEEPYTIVGVVEDFHFEHLSKTVEPLILLYMKDAERDFMIKIAEGKEKEVLPFIENIYSEINPGSIFNYHFLEERLSTQYVRERMLSKIYFFFTVIGVLLSVISLFAFALYETKRRTKEIGIRKISGASITNILKKLGQSFIKPIALSYLIGAPIATLFIRWWLDNYSNRIELTPSVYLITLVLLVLMAGIAVIWQSWKAAIANPVDTLRHE